MQIEIIGFLLLVALCFVIAGWLIKQEEESLYLFLSGFIIVMITGIIVAFSGVDFLNAVIVQNGLISTNQFATPVYVNALISMVFILGGLWGSITMSLAMMRLRKAKKYGEASEA